MASERLRFGVGVRENWELKRMGVTELKRHERQCGWKRGVM